MRLEKQFNCNTCDQSNYSKHEWKHPFKYIRFNLNYLLLKIRFNPIYLVTSSQNRKVKISRFKQRFNKHFSLLLIKASFLEAFNIFMGVKSFVMHKCTHYKESIIKYAVIVSIIITFSPSYVNAKSGLLGKLGMSSNYNRPEIWKDQLGNYATGGSLYARTPTTELQLLSFDMPSFDAGCGGININFGGFGYISGKQIQMLIKQIGTNALSYTVMLTIKSISPQIADLLENLEAMARFMNAQNINSCQLGASIASGLFPKTEASHRLGCQARKMGGNNGGIGDAMSSYFTARENCNDSQNASDTNNEDKDSRVRHPHYWGCLL